MRRSFLGALAAAIVAALPAAGADPAAAPAEITPQQAKDHVGKTVTVCGRVEDAKYLENSKTKPTLLNFGAPHPDAVFTVIIKPETRSKFADLPEAVYYRKEVCVTGVIRLYKEKPEMEVTDPSQIRLKPAPKTP